MSIQIDTGTGGDGHSPILKLSGFNDRDEELLFKLSEEVGKIGGLGITVKFNEGGDVKLIIALLEMTGNEEVEDVLGLYPLPNSEKKE